MQYRVLHRYTVTFGRNRSSVHANESGTRYVPHAAHAHRATAVAGRAHSPVQSHIHRTHRLTERAHYEASHPHRALARSTTAAASAFASHVRVITSGLTISTLEPQTGASCSARNLGDTTLTPLTSIEMLDHVTMPFGGSFRDGSRTKGARSREKQDGRQSRRIQMAISSPASTGAADAPGQSKPCSRSRAVPT